MFYKQAVLHPLVTLVRVLGVLLSLGMFLPLRAAALDGPDVIWRRTDLTPYSDTWIAYSPDGETIAASGFVGSTVLLRASDGVSRTPGIGSGSSYNPIVYSPDGQMLAAAHHVGYNGFSKYVGLWRASDLSPIRDMYMKLESHDVIHNIAFSPDGKTLAVATTPYYYQGVKHPLYICQVSDGSPVKIIDLPSVTRALAFSPDGKFLVAVGRENEQLHGSICVWKTSDWTGRVIEDDRYRYSAAAFSPDWKTLAVACLAYQQGDDNPIKLFNTSDWTQRDIFPGDTSEIASLAFSPEGQVLASGNIYISVLRFRLVADGTILDTLAAAPRMLAYSPDGQRLVFAADGGVFSILNPFRNVVLPNHGGNTGIVTVKIVTPTTFPITDGATVNIQGIHFIGSNDSFTISPNIYPITTSVINSHLLSATFDLRGAVPSWRNLVITSPGSGSQLYPSAFRIDRGSQPELWTEIIGRENFRAGTKQTYTIAYGNRGDTNVYDVLLFLRIPKGVSFAIRGLIPLAIQPPPELDTGAGIEVSGDILIPIWFYAIPAGFSKSIQLDITPPRNGTEDMYVKAELLQSPDSEFSHTGDSNFTPVFLDILGQTLTDAIVATALNNPPSQNPGSGLSEAGDACGCEALAGTDEYEACIEACTKERWDKYHKELLKELDPRKYGFGLALNIFAGGFFVAESPIGVPLLIIAGAFDLYHIYSANRAAREILNDRHFHRVVSADPNDLAGPLGFRDLRWIASAQPLYYTVMFENLPNATAPAAEIVVTDHLDPTNLDLTTLNLESITFADQTVTPTVETSPPVGRRQFEAEVDLRPAKNLLVHIHADLDMLSGNLTFRFSSLDPDTHQPPDDPLAGFLDPGQEGSVLFSVLPNKDVPTGSVVQNQAIIVFDANAPIPTPQWMNTLDNDKPISQMFPLPPFQFNPSFDVYWAGDDVGSGLRDFTIYVSDNDGPFTPWLTNTTETHATFTGELQHVYRFYSAARDNAGNVEQAHLLPDTFIRIVQAVFSRPRKHGSIGTPRPHAR